MGMMDLDHVAHSAPVGAAGLLLSSSPGLEAPDGGLLRSKGPHAKRERMPCFGEDMESGTRKQYWRVTAVLRSSVVRAGRLSDSVGGTPQVHPRNPPQGQTSVWGSAPSLGCRHTPRLAWGHRS